MPPIEGGFTQGENYRSAEGITTAVTDDALLDIDIELDRRINFAMQQNDVPVIKRLQLKNLSSVPLRDLELRITSEPAFAQPWSTRLTEIKPGTTYGIDGVDLDLSPSFLSGLTERVNGRLLIEVITRSATEKDQREDTAADLSVRLLSRSERIELLARDEWSGLSSLPEIMAAFVLPNHPATQDVLSIAADLLNEWSGDPSLSGYQSKNPRRVYEIAAAVFGALQRLELTYINPPASFEDEGQRVRLPGQVLETRMATCLDIAILAAGCLEQAGLHPLLVLVDGHAITGVWLIEETFPLPAMDDGLRLRKRVELDEILLFDPTLATTRPSPDFSKAVAIGRGWLDDIDRFRCVIDIRRARKGRIRPLPERVERPSSGRAPADGTVDTSTVLIAPPDLTGLPLDEQMTLASGDSDINTTASDATAGESKASRLDRWGRKLLDLSLRNRLLNFKDSRKTLPLLCPDPARLEDLLAEGTSFEIHPRPADLSGSDPRDAAAYQRRTGVSGLDELLIEEMNARRIYAATTKDELDRRLIEIYRAGRLALEEGGSSSLFLAVGFLKWYETERSEQPRLAPLVLIPIELVRKSARQGFTLRQGDDDPRFNITLLEMLKQDHGLEIAGLDPLPEDESGLDLPKILRAVRQAVKDIDRWEVLVDVRIGLFSFAKFLMWRDLLERTEELVRNPVVDHLINRPDQPFPTGGIEAPNPDRLDDEFRPTDIYCPLPADSSQIAAIIAAARGLSFVLEGPPGTGKSQTITNLIAHCLAEDKTILFVSEKKAALDVVHRRLVAAGLGRFCLELHSNKAHKAAVLAQLAESLERSQTASSEEWTREARRIETLRASLNAYARVLHAPRSTGDTAFRALSRLIGLRDVPRVHLRWEDPEALNPDDVYTLRDLAARIATAAAATGGVKTHPWAAVMHETWTPAWEAEVTSAVEALGIAVGELNNRVSAAAARVGVDPSDWSLDELATFDELASLLLNAPPGVPALLLLPDWQEIKAQLDSWIRHGRARDLVRAELRAEFRDDIAHLDHDVLRRRLEEANASRWPFSWWRRRPVAKALAGVSRTGKAPEVKRFGPVLEQAAAYSREQARLDAAGDRARELLGRYWNDGEADWDSVARVSDWSGKLRALALRLAREDLDRALELRETLARLTSEGRELLQPTGYVGRDLATFRESWNAFRNARDKLVAVARLNANQEWGEPASPGALRAVQKSVEQWRASVGKLRNWCPWRSIRTEAVGKGLAPLVEAFEAGEFGSEDIPRVFERSFTQWWLDEITNREPALSQFFSPVHEDTIEKFRAADERYMELTSQVIQARLSERLPVATTSVLPNSELGILKRELGKKRRQMPLRQLFQRIPNLLPRLKPCLLMSPMSVAQYLDSSFPPFDLVVFDEASQIPVWDAIGALGRAKQAVIVGDPKQLPPTNFFQRAEADDEFVDEDVIEDLESILDDCLSAQLPWLPLDWHYRSRHESLIAFSNFHYYRNRLLTFASPVREGMGVTWCHVSDGYYDKGKSRTNRREADAVVAEIVRRLRDPELSKSSIGVVTFSQAQQRLIEDLLDTERYKHPELDAFFAEDLAEPVFVKNLENVQGDERDVILFSICYGPDRFGKVSMNFGPMNRDGGERRLNVAITRARREVRVFSTLRADQIDLTRTRAKGVAHLKAFLEYAERGPSALGEMMALDLDAEFESPFEEAVYDALVARGWEVHKQVGCASYRIDLAVVDPKTPGRYVIGIECDGANYHRAKTARDRDKLREGVLRGLGWELHRIWSTDWWLDPEKEIEKAESAIRRAMERVVTVGSFDSGLVGGGLQTSSTPESIAGPRTFVKTTEPGRLMEHGSSDAATSQEAPGLEIYHPVNLPAAGDGTPDSFYDPRAEAVIRAQIDAVVRGEGPVSLDLTAKRIAAAWGFGRTTNRLVARIQALATPATVAIQNTAGGVFLWPAGMAPDRYAGFRVPDRNGEGERQPPDLPLEEVANAAAFLLASHFSAPLEELIRETARLFGFMRLGRRVDERIREGIELLVRRGDARLGDGVVVKA